MPELRLPAPSRWIRFALPLIAATTLSACGGGGGDDGGNGGGNPPSSVTVSGKITFDRIPFKTSGSGLNPAAPVESPARQVVVEALDASNDSVLATANTNTSGDYSFDVPANRSMKIRAKAQMLKSGTAPTWDFRVLNNTNSNALYVLDDASFNSGTASSTRNLRAASGWGTTSYTGTRAAAPFAILDSAYQAKELILSASAATAFPALNLYWSATNKPTEGVFCTNNGDIGTTFYTPANADADNCTPNGALLAGIYVLGDFGQGDTDEFDQSVIAHEFGHYVEDKFSRSDSIGGEHGIGNRLDMRVAFGEGWGNAYSGMVLNSPVYRDSFQGVDNDSGFNIESDSPVAEGWFSESSVGEILWDIFDATADANDQVSLGFAPIYAVMTGAQRNTDALTSIFSFADALRSANAAQTAGINALLNGELISDSNAFGNNESNAGGSPTALPIYREATPNQPLPPVCGSGADASRNKLGYRRFLRLQLDAASAITITATGAVDPNTTGSVAAVDPDIFVRRRGEIVAFSDLTGSSETISQQPLAAGTYIIEVYDFSLSGASTVPHCMTVSISGN